MIPIKWNRKIVHLDHFKAPDCKVKSQYLNLTWRHARAPKALNGLAAMCAALVAYLSSFALFIPLSLPKEIQSLVACGSTSSISTQETRGVPVRWSAWGTKPCVSRACPRCAQTFQLIWSRHLYLPTQNLCQNQRTLNNLKDVRNSYIALENVLHSFIPCNKNVFIISYSPPPFLFYRVFFCATFPFFLNDAFHDSLTYTKNTSRIGTSNIN
jgi:hypothetical protein